MDALDIFLHKKIHHESDPVIEQKQLKNQNV